jgi:hypothetical protein
MFGHHLTQSFDFVVMDAWLILGCILDLKIKLVTQWNFVKNLEKEHDPVVYLFFSFFDFHFMFGHHLIFGRYV